MNHQQSGLGTQQYVRKLPRIPREDIYANAEARRRAYQQSMQEADPSYSGHSAGLHPEHRPYITDERNARIKAGSSVPIKDDCDLEEDERYYTTRSHSSARRYQLIPDVMTRQGRVNVVEHYHDQPLRAHRQQLQPPRQREIYTDEVETPVAKNKRRIHPLLYLGVGMLAMLALFVLLSSAATWLQEKQNDFTYGRPRTFQIDAVVGHNDSSANPSHFIAVNLNRHVQVIEIPGQDSTKERTFQITTLYGDGEDLTPVTLSFRDVNGDRKSDMLIHIEQQTLVMINENGSFRPAKAGEVKGLL